MTFYAGQLLYCIDKEHPLYGKRLKVDSPLHESEDGTPAVLDIETRERVNLATHQLSVYAPEKPSL